MAGRREAVKEGWRDEDGENSKKLKQSDGQSHGHKMHLLLNSQTHVGEVGAYPHTEACPHTLLFAHLVTSG